MWWFCAFTWSSLSCMLHAFFFRAWNLDPGPGRHICVDAPGHSIFITFSWWFSCENHSLSCDNDVIFVVCFVRTLLIFMRKSLIFVVIFMEFLFWWLFSIFNHTDGECAMRSIPNRGRWSSDSKLPQTTKQQILSSSCYLNYFLRIYATPKFKINWQCKLLN